MAAGTTCDELHVRRSGVARTTGPELREHAKELILAGKRVLDDRDTWSEHEPSAKQENDFIKEHCYPECGLCFSGVDDAADPETKSHDKFPYADFERFTGASARCLVRVRADRVDDGDEAVETPVEVGLVDHEGRCQPEGVAVGLLREHPLLHQ